MNRIYAIHPLRWFLLLWIGMVYLWGVLAQNDTYLHVLDRAKQRQLALQPVGDLPATTVSSVNTPLILFTFLMILCGLLLWFGFSATLSKRLQWLYFLLLAVLIFFIGSVIHQINVVLSLYLALTLVAVSILQRARSITLIITGSLFLVIVFSAFSIGVRSWDDWSLLLSSLWISTDYPALLLFSIGYLALYSHQKHMHTQLTQAHQELATIHQELEGTHQQLQVSTEQIKHLSHLTERQRLARELHDTLSQSLVGLVFQLDVAKSHLEQKHVERAHQIMQEASSSARVALSEARHAIADLRTNTPTPDTLCEAIQEELDRFTTATGIECTTELAVLTTIPLSQCEHVLRAISEGLTNIARHAQAHHVVVAATRQPQGVHIEIRDDGCGFQADTVLTQSGGHYGLVGLRERARLAGGRMKIMSVPGKGTTLSLFFSSSAGRKEAIYS